MGNTEAVPLSWNAGELEAFRITSGLWRIGSNMWTEKQTIPKSIIVPILSFQAWK